MTLPKLKPWQWAALAGVGVLLLVLVRRAGAASSVTTWRDTTGGQRFITSHVLFADVTVGIPTLDTGDRLVLSVAFKDGKSQNYDASSGNDPSAWAPVGNVY
jgi:hypothetical protein